MKLASCNKFYPNNCLLINIPEKFEVLTVVMTMLFFWVMTPCRLVGRYTDVDLIFILLYYYYAIIPVLENSLVIRSKRQPPINLRGRTNSI
jgi:hypothetical protein